MDLVSGSDNALSELIRNLQDSISRLKEYEADDGFDVQEGENFSVTVFFNVLCRGHYFYVNYV